MVCRKGVKSYLNGGVEHRASPIYNPAEKCLVIVFDVQKKAYRSINLSTVKHIKIHGEEYNVGE